MKLPSEIVVDSFLPTFRSLLASELDDRGFTQQEIADRLGVSQPAVSKYVADEVGVEDAIATDERVRDTVERVAEGFDEGTIDEYEALSEVVGLVLRGLGCDLCVAGGDSSLLVENEVLANVRRAVRRLKTVPGLAAHVPNVGTNVAQALPEPDGTSDVAAVPGRVYAMNGRVHVPANPEFGASKNVAAVTLAAASVDPTKRAALNLATSETLLKATSEAGMGAVEFDPDRDRRREALDDAFADGVPDVAYHRGGFGVEPVAYVIAEDAPAAVEKVERLLR